MNRSDIHIAVTENGTMLIAQGNPALYILCSRGDLADRESGLYYSQLFHRTAWKDSDGVYHVGTPTEAGKYFNGQHYRCQLTAGTVHTIGRVD